MSEIIIGRSEKAEKFLQAVANLKRSGEFDSSVTFNGDPENPILHVVHRGLISNEPVNGIDRLDVPYIESVLKRMVKAHVKKIERRAAKKTRIASRDYSGH